MTPGIAGDTRYTRTSLGLPLFCLQHWSHRPVLGIGRLQRPIAQPVRREIHFASSLDDAKRWLVAQPTSDRRPIT